MEFNRCFGCMQPKTTGPVCEHCGYDENEGNKPHQLPAGTVLREQYLVGRVLGQGGFGITYLGWDLTLDVPIAIKEFYPNGFVARDCTISLSVTECEGNRQEYYQNSRARFLREAKALAKFSGIPEIVAVRNFFEENNTAYIIMEYVQGVDLRQHMLHRGGTLSVEETLQLLKPVMRALTEVHKAELVHRDISPDNIMLLSDGNVKLLDFGAVRDVENAGVEKDLPQSTEAILKHGFAPMEQYQKRGALGPWTDVYALCATAYFCMTGRLPPDAPARIMDDVHPDWSDIPGLSESRRAALEKGAAVRAKDRTASVLELYEQLFREEEEKAAESEKKASQKPKKEKKKRKPAPKQPEETPEQEETPKKEKKKSKWRISPLLTIAAILFILIGGVYYLGPYFAPHLFAQEETAPNWEGNTLLQADYVHVYGTSDLLRSQIRSITFLDTLAEAPEKSWDASKTRNGLVRAWITENDGLYDLYVAAEGGINVKDSCSQLFYGFSSAERIEFGKAFHMEGAENLSRMFYECSSLKELDLSGFDTAAATDMSRMFYKCSSLTRLNLGSFDTANVTDMSYMFYSCSGLKSVDVTSFDTSKVTDMSYMFNLATGTIEIDTKNFSTHAVTSYLNFMDPEEQVNGAPWKNLFQWKTNKLMKIPDDTVFGTKLDKTLIRSITFLDTVKNAPRTSWDVSASKDKRILAWTEANGQYYDLYIAAEGGVCAGYYSRGLFSGYSNVETIDFGDAFFIDGTNSLENLFSGCGNLIELDLSTFRTEEVKNMSAMFKGCTRLRRVNLSSFDTSRVTNMWGMFWDCTNLKELDLSGFQTGNVVNMSYMFRNCSNLKSLDVSGFETGNVVNMSYMFYGTTNNVTIDPEKFDTRNARSSVHFMNEGVMVNGAPWEEMFSE